MKQAFSFLKIGDKSSAKLLLQQVIKDYPDTNQARMARTRLQESDNVYSHRLLKMSGRAFLTACVFFIL